MTKEHVFPEWLILRTGTNRTGIRWGDVRRLPALAATLPLCEECNWAFGQHLEAPAAKVFDQVEAGEGLSDADIELLIRWMWKIKGMDWLANHPKGRYTDTYTLRERVLRPIDDTRKALVFGMALFAELHPESDDLPMGMNSKTQQDAIFVAGVFSRIAMMVVLEPFESLMPPQFRRHRFSGSLGTARLFYPPNAFRDDVEAVGVTAVASVELSRRHDAHSARMRSRFDRSK
jgi:hypothetical protein